MTNNHSGNLNLDNEEHDRKIMAMQKLVDEALVGGDSDKSLAQIRDLARQRARLF